MYQGQQSLNMWSFSDSLGCKLCCHCTSSFAYKGQHLSHLSLGVHPLIHISTRASCTVGCDIPCVVEHLVDGGEKSHVNEGMYSKGETRQMLTSVGKHKFDW